MERFGWCFIGSGKIAKQVLVDFPMVDGAYLASVYSPTFANAQALAAQYGAQAYATLEDAVADTNVQAVYVATTINAHKAHTLAALRLGKPVLCEKPFALSRSEAEEMMGEANRQGCFLMEAMWMRLNPAIEKALEWVRAGRIGRVERVEANFAIQLPKVIDRLALNALDGGSLMCLGVYPLSIAQFVLDDALPTEIHATANMTPERVDSHCTFDLCYANGATAHLFSAIDTNAVNDAVIRGERGTITVPGFVRARRAEIETSEGTEIFALENETSNGYQHQFRAVMEDIRAGRKENARIPHAHTLRVMEILDKVRAEIGLSFGSSDGHIV